MKATSPCRTYIVFANALFAEGVRSALESEGGVEVVGMDDDIGRAAVAVEELEPDVILVEESVDCREVWPFLEAAVASRIVTVSLDHSRVTVYDGHRTTAADPRELVAAMVGGREPALSPRAPRSVLAGGAEWKGRTP